MLSSAFIPEMGLTSVSWDPHKIHLGPEVWGSLSNCPPSFVEREQVARVCMHA